MLITYTRQAEHPGLQLETVQKLQQSWGYAGVFIQRVVHRVQRAEEEEGRQQALLGLLLRWDVGAGAPSDMVPAARLAWLERMCAEQGEDPEALQAVAAAALQA